MLSLNAIFLEKTAQQMIAQTFPSFTDSVSHNDLSSEQIQSRLEEYSKYLLSVEVYESIFLRLSAV